MPSATSMPVMWWKSGCSFSVAVVVVSCMAAKEAIPGPQA